MLFKYNRIHELKHHKRRREVPFMKLHVLTPTKIILKLEGHQKDWDLWVLEAIIKIPV